MREDWSSDWKERSQQSGRMKKGETCFECELNSICATDTVQSALALWLRSAFQAFCPEAWSTPLTQVVKHWMLPWYWSQFWQGSMGSFFKWELEPQLLGLKIRVCSRTVSRCSYTMSAGRGVGGGDGQMVTMAEEGGRVVPYLTKGVSDCCESVKRIQVIQMQSYCLKKNSPSKWPPFSKLFLKWHSPSVRLKKWPGLNYARPNCLGSIYLEHPPTPPRTLYEKVLFV